jgi:hypothetical protein
VCDSEIDLRPATCVTYRCSNGCVHLVWNNFTLHMRPHDWDLLARTVAETDQVVRDERARRFPHDAPAM